MIAHPSFWRGIGSHQLRNPPCKYSELFLFPNNYTEKCHPFEVAFFMPFTKKRRNKITSFLLLRLLSSGRYYSSIRLKFSQWSSRPDF